SAWKRLKGGRSRVQARAPLSRAAHRWPCWPSGKTRVARWSSFFTTRLNQPRRSSATGHRRGCARVEGSIRRCVKPTERSSHMKRMLLIAILAGSMIGLARGYVVGERLHDQRSREDEDAIKQVII